jgi:hypothetical protein
MKGVPPWLVRWARLSGSRDFYPACSGQSGTKYFFLTVKYLNLCPGPHRTATWASSRAGLPISECASPTGTTEGLHVKECTVQLTESSIYGIFSDKIFVDVP